MSNDSVCTFNSSTITFVVRRELILPSSAIPPSDTLSYLIRFPGGMFYSKGARDFIENYLGQDDMDRSHGSQFKCQRNMFYGTIFADSCVWLKPLSAGSTDTTYRAYFGTVVWEDKWWSWSKLVIRCLLTLYILCVLWQRYWRHYKPLMRSLQRIGVGDQRYCHYVIIAGDPTYMILSDPWVSLVMTMDIVITPAYASWSVLRVGQFNDLGTLSLGCSYSTRHVWSDHLAMRCLSYIVQARRREFKFAPIDPGLLGFGALLYGGPLMSLIGNTILMVVFQSAWTWFVPSDLLSQAVEVSIGTIMALFLLACLPVALSLTIRK
ncbi:hypothetical protein AeMF1_005472 [Aphanomyces euteiches]|nr:hypothetical protein AeMF1_005472 [Aphanomyces euteiches]KAH9186900.1 hypothetical protein AeNC1_011125 [Aphanomyces euteiches]